MLTHTDVISLSCTPDLVESGIACACRSLTQAGFTHGSACMDRLRLLVVEVAAELAFRRYLAERGVPFGVCGASPLADPVHFDASLGGHRCILETTLVSRRREISRLRRERGFLLGSSALIPLEQFASQEGRPDDIHLFAYLLGLVAASRSDMERAQAAGQPISLVHPLPGKWRRPSPWVPLGDLVLKSESDEPLRLEVCGQDAERNFITRSLELLPRTRTPVEGGFYSVLCLRIRQRSHARLGIHSPAHGEPYIVSPFDWGNLWVYGMQILLTGWLTRENFRRKAIVLNPGRNTVMGDRIDQKCLHVPVEDLNPLAPLLSRVRAWEQEKEHPMEADN